ncbi:hypothetical protein [Cellulomonas carbonis]|uniref:Uncharacterized protein n=1 Tax=Cellulomonas carbonis T26 TaxID=947969 RepID=A0A0A0BUK0_9CELL|nr:hypothetical protein [Cellulomonas carbonis]KGM11601.1 hypothetical protein N868_05535 [Cellulomonas carbonis T26]GGC06909.1 hypothetical protein GCM10010972_20200 [Cellulomonas carbonis]
MELAVRLSLQPLPDPSAAPPTGGLVVGAIASLVLLALGLAHYAGRFRTLAEVWILGPTVVLACAWLGAGGLLATIGAALAGQDDAVLVLLGAVAVVLALVAWVVGIVGIFWLPRALQPRWFVEQVERDPARMRGGRMRGRKEQR